MSHNLSILRHLIIHISVNKRRQISTSECAIIGFDHGVPCRVKTMSLGPQWRKKPRPSAPFLSLLRPMFFIRHGGPWPKPTTNCISFKILMLIQNGRYFVTRVDFLEWKLPNFNSNSKFRLYQQPMTCLCDSRCMTSKNCMQPRQTLHNSAAPIPMACLSGLLFHAIQTGEVIFHHMNDYVSCTWETQLFLNTKTH